MTAGSATGTAAKPRSSRSSVWPYVGAVALAGAGLLAVAFVTLDTTGWRDWAYLATFGGVSLLSVWMPVRFHHPRGIQGFNLEGATLVGMLYVLPPAIAPAVTVAAAIIGYATKTRSTQKTVFNVGQNAIWAVAATFAFDAVIGAGAPAASLRGVVAGAAAVIVMVPINTLLLAELFHRLDGRGRERAIRDVSRLVVMTLAGNVVYGLVLGIMAEVSPFALGLGGLLILGTFLGYRAYGRVLNERVRADRFHSLTRTLVEGVSDPASLNMFAEEVRQLFGAERAVVVIRGVPEIIQSTVENISEELPEAAERRLRAISEAALVGAKDGLPAGIVVPLIADGEGRGMIGVFGRVGVEPWGEVDLKTLGSVANEATVAFKNVELFQQVERERLRLESESTKLSDIVNAASDGIAMFSADGEIVAWNEAMVRVTGALPTQALGHPWFVVMRARDANGNELLPDGDHHVNRALGGERYTEPVELQLLRRDGKWRYLRATFAPVHHEDDGAAGTVMVARDVTAEREVDELKSDFIATVSHELRTPLTPLKGFLETLQRHRDTLAEDELETIHESMSSQVKRLERLINDLLVVADLDRDAMALRTDSVSLAQAVRVAIAQHTPDQIERITVEGSEDVTVVGDGTAVVRIIRSLTSNAVKHTVGPVRVSVDVDHDHGVVRVRDHGPGIPPWEQEEIFKRFRRLGNHLTRTQGPGLGLPIASALADRLGGRVTVESDIGAGSTFSVLLPLARPRAVHPDGLPLDQTSRASSA